MKSEREIIIDGVNVSECIHIDNWKHCNCCNDLIKTIYPKATKCHIEEDLRCEFYPNCYFKQLKRKEQEYEKYKQTLAEIKDITEKQCNICEALTPIDEYKDCKKCWQGKILQKISEVENEN